MGPESPGTWTPPPLPSPGEKQAEIKRVQSRSLPHHSQLAPHPTSPAQGGNQHNPALASEPGPRETTLNKKALCILEQRSQVCSRDKAFLHNPQ